MSRSDFDDDGFDDLAIGVPLEDIRRVRDAGAVNVLRGSAIGPTDTGLIHIGDQFWHEGFASVIGDAERGDRFGRALASGDFNNDGIDDLAIGKPGEDIGRVQIADAGAINVLYGSRHGLSAADTAMGNQTWHEDTPNVRGDAEPGDSFGNALASGDFNNDGVDDLAIGKPLEDIGTVPIVDAGAINVLHGKAGEGLTHEGNRTWHQNTDIAGGAGNGDLFGSALASGDFNNDGIDDLAIGVPGEGIGTPARFDAGAVNVLYGKEDDGLVVAGNEFWHQNTDIKDDAESSDLFGSALASGDFDGDGIDDLAIGVPRENIGEIEDAGAVNVLYGKEDDGLIVAGNEFWHQNTAIEGSASDFFRFGSALASGDFNNDGVDDLAIGVPGWGLESIQAAGAVSVLYGSADRGLIVEGNQLWRQGVNSVEDSREAGDRFGSALTVGDFDNDGFDDLAIGVSGEGIEPLEDAGMIHVLYGSEDGLTATGVPGDQRWHQNSSGILDRAEPSDLFGFALA